MDTIDFDVSQADEMVIIDEETKKERAVETPCDASTKKRKKNSKDSRNSRPANAHMEGTDDLENDVENAKGGVTTVSEKFNEKASRDALVKYIVIDELPFKHVEGEGFKLLVNIVCPRMVLPSR
ncbi:Zinc finger BED domain-containing protein RICESLEEPER 2-like [Quillaja saponaria]|uniref:Zinc finger BED domain-containing protein RICESLEEPER 2-like n=1 Tax=Quillaja saponaria TaxID=32244 RepID=A0AAD7PYH6_QUISA|nr:Zinc finger BED domain-containing protein RICESLEEPER 2-like [Quillaja saponaria]KAJ7971509.1 Zinc finger BED domain-containing protein RICESLEEPER 2-like [Quillaja saponaria]